MRGNSIFYQEVINVNYFYFNSNQIANLFPRDEMDEILGELVGVMKKEFPRRPPTNEHLYEYFLSRTRAHLHVCLCFSPVSTHFFRCYTGLHRYNDIFQTETVFVNEAFIYRIPTLSCFAWTFLVFSICLEFTKYLL